MPGPASNKGGSANLLSSSNKSSSGNKVTSSSAMPKPVKNSSSSSSSAVTSSPKKKSGTGLTILWIPGRKKHHDKGVYKPTNHNIEHKHGDRKNEPWSLGGSKSHDDIINGGDSDDKLNFIKPTTPKNVCSSASLGVASVNIDTCSESDAEIKLEKKDFDSIERFDDLDGAPKLSYPNGLKSKDPKKKEDKAVKCLYYTMMCCECTIS